MHCDLETERCRCVRNRERQLALKRAQCFTKQILAAGEIHFRSAASKNRSSSHELEMQDEHLNSSWVFRVASAWNIYANVDQIKASQLNAAEWEKDEGVRWSIVRQNALTQLGHVDFWSRPIRPLSYADQLPSEIGRGTLFYSDDLRSQQPADLMPLRL